MDENQLVAEEKLNKNPVIEQVVTIYKEMPLSRKIVMGVVVFLVLLGFAGMFFWANKTEFKPLYSGLAPEDAAAVVEKLKEEKVKYRIGGDGSVLYVSAAKVYDVRLFLAGQGLPKGGEIGYELFDETSFGTTEFVQKLNQQRALQGELVRTIKEFDEVIDAKVMIVMPKDSIFIEETKLPSASVLLKLKTNIDEEKVQAVVHLVSSAIEDLTPDMVTVVDTTGRILFKGESDEEKARIRANSLANMQLQYKMAVERNLTERIQMMLERIVGKDKAVVIVTADMDFHQVESNEEIYDPQEKNVLFLRSKKSLVESTDKTTTPQANVSSVNPVLPPGQNLPTGNPSNEKCQKQDETANYELSRIVNHTIKPLSVLKRLAVAAVIDGKYTFETDEDGSSTRKYLPRSLEEMEKFRVSVQNAMGFNDGREDMVSVECFPFSTIEEPKKSKKSWQTYLKDNFRGIINMLLVLLVFIFIVLPLIKTMRDIKETVIETALPTPDEQALELLDLDEDKDALPDPSTMPTRQKAEHYAAEDMNKVKNIIRGWLVEVK